MTLPRDYRVMRDGNDSDVYFVTPSFRDKDHALPVYVPVRDRRDRERMAEEVARRLNVAPEPDANPAVTVTKEQAVAFLNVLVGMAGEAYLSPHVVTHLDAVMGIHKRPSWFCMSDWLRDADLIGGKERVNNLIDYLHAVVHALQAHREALRP
jgi:hypothetical protein